MKNTNNIRKGFTLIELSIVLVIIGLIVGGVLVGRDLMKAAEVRAFITQIEKYNTATNTFYSKYDALPGDFQNAATLWNPAGCCYNGITGGNNNGQIEFSYGIFTYGNNSLDEVANFFYHLSVAGLIEGMYISPQGTYPGGVWTPFTTTVGAGYNWPAAKAGTGSGIMAFYYKGANQWYTGIAPGPACLDGHGTDNVGCLTDATFMPSEAYAIDQKIDNGKPISGRVQAYWGFTQQSKLDPSSGVNVQNPGAAVCANASSSYNLGAAYKTIPLCQMMIQFQ